MQQQINLDIVFITDDFNIKSKHKKILASMPNEENYSSRSYTNCYNDAILNDLLSYNPLSFQQQMHIFKRLNFLKFIYNKTKRNKIFDKIIKDRDLLALTNMRLIAGIFPNKHIVIGDLFSEAIITIFNCVERFDYRRNIKFSTYATWALTNTIFNLNRKNKKYQMEEHCYDSNLAINCTLYKKFDNNDNVKYLFELLTDDEKELIKDHYGIDCEQKTFRDLSEKEGVTPQAIQRRHRLVIRKLRRLSEHAL